ncbi:hypothetical protein Lal_00010429 [Lupinus albus]|nr:hypothetical protein Lal_00010429 [Lupinus albus]
MLRGDGERRCCGCRHLLLYAGIQRLVRSCICNSPDFRAISAAYLQKPWQEENTTIRRPFKADAPVKEGPRSNREIRVPRVQLIDEEGQNLGSMPTDQALKMAEEAGLDLVEISPNAEPPVCKILDLGKLKYSTQKKAAEARKKQKIVEVKEIKMRPNIDTHDYDVKMKAMNRFFDEGDKVKVTLKFRGREMAHQELGMKLLLQVKEDTQAIAKVEAEPKLEGRQMMMVLAPK